MRGTLDWMGRHGESLTPALPCPSGQSLSRDCPFFVPRDSAHSRRFCYADGIMVKPRRVILYGRSVILGTLSASLGDYSGLEIVQLSPPLPAPHELAALGAQVILFDLNAVSADFPFTLLREQPDLLLIGLDAAGDRLLVLSGQQAHALTTTELVQVILGNSAGYLANRSLEP